MTHPAGIENVPSLVFQTIRGRVVKATIVLAKDSRIKPETLWSKNYKTMSKSDSSVQIPARRRVRRRTAEDDGKMHHAKSEQPTMKRNTQNNGQLPIIDWQLERYCHHRQQRAHPQGWHVGYYPNMPPGGSGSRNYIGKAWKSSLFPPVRSLLDKQCDKKPAKSWIPSLPASCIPQSGKPN